MKALLTAMVSFLAIAGGAGTANARPIVIFDEPILITVPDGYVDASVERNLPPENALFLTEIVEPWEEAGEVNEGILFYGLGLKPSTEAVKQQKFDEIFDFVRQRMAAQVETKPFAMPEALIDADLIDSIFDLSRGRNARAVEVTDDRADRKALLIDTGLVMPGVVTYPIIEEISFVRVKDRIIIFHATRVDTAQLDEGSWVDKDVRKRLKGTGVEVRDGLIDGE